MLECGDAGAEVRDAGARRGMCGSSIIIAGDRCFICRLYLFKT